MLAALPGLCQRGFEITVAGPTPGPLADAVARTPAAWAPFPMRDAVGNRRPDDELRASLAKRITAHQPAVIHCNSLAATVNLGPLAAELGLPVIGHVRDMVKLGGRSLARLGRASRLVAVSHAARDYLCGLGVAATRIRVIYNGVDSECFRPREATGAVHRELGLPDGSPLVLAVGQIILRKGWPILFDAFEQVLASEPQARLLVVGERYSDKPETVALEQNLRRRANGPPLAGKVVFLGARDDMPRLMNEAAALVHAAMQEPLGRVLLEAAASGLPVVATDAGGTREIFLTDRHALLAPPQDATALASGVLSVLQDPSAAAARAAQARAHVCRHFTVRQAVQGMAETYQPMRRGNPAPHT